MPGDFTQLLHDVQSGREAARAELMHAAYEELRLLAAGAMDGERQNHTLTATTLVNELSVRLLGDAKLPAEGRRPFFAYAAKAMRSLLVDYARSRAAQKRGGGQRVLQLDEALVACKTQSDTFLELHEALERLEVLDGQKAAVVEMRYFGGLGVAEVAESLDISAGTVKREWARARVWLLHDLERASSSEKRQPGVKDTRRNSE